MSTTTQQPTPAPQVAQTTPQATPTTPADPAAVATGVPPQTGVPGQPGQPMGPNNQYLSASLYIGDLHPEVNEAILYEIFTKIGPVASVRVCRDAVTRRSLGYAYVNYHAHTDAENALKDLNYSDIKGRTCRIMWCHRDPSKRKSGAGNIFIKNLAKTIDNKSLYDTFEIFGNILSCKVVSDQNGESRGYGFVHYESQEAADEAVAKVNGMEIEGQLVSVTPFIPKKDRIAEGQRQFTNVFLKNLPETMSEEELKTECEKFGAITSLLISKGDDEKSKGFAFVNFEKFEEAKACVDELNGKELGGKVLYVGRAQKKSEREADLRSRWDRIKQERMEKYQGVNLYVKNLEDTVDDDALRKQFEKFGTITSSKIMIDDKGVSKGFGFVCFTTPDEATKAVTEMNGKMLGSKPLYVALAQRKEVRRAQLEAAHNQRAVGVVRGMPGMPGQPGMYPPAPMYFNPQGFGPQRGGNFMYGQPQMMRGNQWRGPPNAMGRGGFAGQPMPYANMGMGMQMGGQMGRQMGGPKQRRVPQQAGPKPMRGNGGPQGNRGFKYTANVRNGPGPQNGMQGGPLPGQGVSGGQGMPANALSNLAAASPEQQRAILGEHLFVQIQEMNILPNQEDVSKITGMLLDLDLSEVLHLLETEDALRAKVAEAKNVLVEKVEPESGVTA